MNYQAAAQAGLPPGIAPPGALQDPNINPSILNSFDLQQLNNALNAPGTGHVGQTEYIRKAGYLLLRNGFDPRREPESPIPLYSTAFIPEAANVAGNQGMANRIQAALGSAASSVGMTPSEGLKPSVARWEVSLEPLPVSVPETDRSPQMRLAPTSVFANRMEYTEEVPKTSATIYNGAGSLHDRVALARSSVFEYLNPRQRRSEYVSDDQWLIESDPTGISAECLRVPDHPTHAEYRQLVGVLARLSKADLATEQFNPIYKGEYSSHGWGHSLQLTLADRQQLLTHSNRCLIDALALYLLKDPASKGPPSYGSKEYDYVWMTWRLNKHGRYLNTHITPNVFLSS